MTRAARGGARSARRPPDSPLKNSARSMRPSREKGTLLWAETTVSTQVGEDQCPQKRDDPMSRPRASASATLVIAVAPVEGLEGALVSRAHPARQRLVGVQRGRRQARRCPTGSA